MTAAPCSVPVAITGSGIVCALGSSKEQVWQAIVRGECGIGPLSCLEQRPPDGHDGGEVPGARALDDRVKSREVALLQPALHEALAEAGIERKWPCAGERVAIVLGTTLGGMRAGGRFLRSEDLASLRDFTAASVLQCAFRDLPAGGLAVTTCAACASGLASVALGVTLLRQGQCDLVIAGGYDPISEYACAGFSSLRLVADGPPRPFSRDRRGMKLGEGYAIVVLERAESARQRHANALALVAGFGESSDAHHLTQPEPSGEGAARAMHAALRDAGVQPHQIDLISAHATATPNNDAAEFAAYRRVFGDHLPHVPVVAFKSHLGHTLGGAGTVELVLSLLAMRHQTIPPTATVCATEIEFPGLDVAVEVARDPRLQTTLNLSMGFGGANACVILKRPEVAESAITENRAPSIDLRVRKSESVFITGVGVLLPGAIGNEGFLRCLEAGGRQGLLLGGALNEGDYAHLLEARRARRLCEYVKLMLAATNLAMQDAGVNDAKEFALSCGAILGTTHGPAGYSEAYYRQVVREGMSAANPLLFAEGVPNVGSAQLSLALGLKGGTQTVIGSRTAGLEALCLAFYRIAGSECDRLIVGAAEERSELIEAACRACGWPHLISGSGAVALVVESGRSVNARNVRPRGRIVASDGRRVSMDSPVALARAAASMLEPDIDEPALRISTDECLAGVFSVAPLVEATAALLNPVPATAKNRAGLVSLLATDPIGLAVTVRLECGPACAGFALDDSHD
jgi:3-oxoacyl-[acyl-carrier-protein] synthase II